MRHLPQVVLRRVGGTRCQNRIFAAPMPQLRNSLYETTIGQFLAHTGVSLRRGTGSLPKKESAFRFDNVAFPSAMFYWGQNPGQRRLFRNLKTSCSIPTVLFNMSRLRQDLACSAP